MTRKEFLNIMVKSILGYSIIEFKEKKNDKIEYDKTGTLIKDCTYTQHYHKKIVELICSIFDKSLKTLKITNENKPIETYQDNARNFLNYIYKYNSKEEICNNLHDLLHSDLEDMDYIYKYIIIDEIFHVEECSKQCGNDDFDDSVNNIIKKINSHLKEIRLRNFCSAVTDTGYNKINPEYEVFYKSSELSKRNADIKEYLEIKQYDFVILNNNVTDFKLNTVYRYTGECFFEVGKNDETIIYFHYNNQRIQSCAPTRNWLNISIPSNYTYTGVGLYLNCYFYYYQGRVFKILQISEADIKAEI